MATSFYWALTLKDLSGWWAPGFVHCANNENLKWKTWNLNAGLRKHGYDCEVLRDPKPICDESRSFGSLVVKWKLQFSHQNDIYSNVRAVTGLHQSEELINRRRLFSICLWIVANCFLTGILVKYIWAEDAMWNSRK